MSLHNIRTSYDAIISLGAYCQTAYQLKRKNLRTFSAPLDWMISSNLANVNLLLQNNFKNFMDYNNLIIQDIPNDYSYVITDSLYNIESHHDFPLVLKDKHPLSSYPVFKEKLNKKIEIFNHVIASGGRMLFVRMVANYEEVVELNSILKQIVKGDFSILIINFSQDIKVTERFWDIDNVGSVEIIHTFPQRWEGCDSSWNEILQGISLTKK